jgi:hypothetical protein
MLYSSVHDAVPTYDSFFLLWISSLVYLINKRFLKKVHIHTYIYTVCSLFEPLGVERNLGSWD